MAVMPRDQMSHSSLYPPFRATAATSGAILQAETLREQGVAQGQERGRGARGQGHQDKVAKEGGKGECGDTWDLLVPWRLKQESCRECEDSLGHRGREGGWEYGLVIK